MDHVAISLSICTSHMIHSVTKTKFSNSHLKPQNRPTLPKTPPEFQRPNLSAAVAFERISGTGNCNAGKKIPITLQIYEGQKNDSHFLAGWSQIAGIEKSTAGKSGTQTPNPATIDHQHEWRKKTPPAKAGLVAYSRSSLASAEGVEVAFDLGTWLMVFSAGFRG